MSEEKLIIFPSQDFKYREWSKALKEFGIETYADSKPFIFAPFTLIALILSGKNISAYVFRYLNDKRSFVKSFLKAICDILVSVICKFAKIKIYWILHNVDRETIVHHPKITRLRRYLLKRVSTKIWVMDRRLLDHASSQGLDNKKLDWLCFGSPTFKKPNAETLTLREKIISFSESIKQKYNCSNVYVGLCVSSPLAKFTHFLHAPSFVDTASSDDSVVCLVIYGKIPNYSKFSHLPEAYVTSGKILHINHNYQIDETVLSDNIDFIYRSVNDLSVSYSVYVATAMGKPIITHDNGFIQEMVSAYNLGLVISNKKSNVGVSVPIFLDQWDNSNAKKFIETYTWELAAWRISNSL